MNAIPRISLYFLSPDFQPIVTVLDQVWLPLNMIRNYSFIMKSVSNGTVPSILHLIEDQFLQ